MSETLFKDTGLGNEIFTYEFTLGCPNCSECQLQFNYPQVAPCNDCAGYKETNRSYFKEKTWGFYK
jgi:hypothetical protein